MDFKEFIKEAAAKYKIDDPYDLLTTAFAYIVPDGTKKLCGDRCMFHVEEGENKNRCVLMGKDVVIPNLASCNYYIKGPAADPDSKLTKALDPSFAGLVFNHVQCKNCIRANEDVSVCQFLTAILNKVFDSKKEYQIRPEACCNAEQSKDVKTSQK